MMGVARTVAATADQELTTGRTQIWENVIHAIFRNPLFGYGPGQMPAVAPCSDMGQAHNLVLEVLLSWGIRRLRLRARRRSSISVACFRRFASAASNSPRPSSLPLPFSPCR